MNNDTFAHRRAFYFLKKYSSYTWGQEIFKLTKQFGEEIEKILRNPPPEFAPVIDIDEEFLRTCWYDCGDIEEGLNLLLQGDKTIGYSKYGDGIHFACSALQGDPDRGAASRYLCTTSTEKKYVAIGYANSYRRVSTGIFALLEQAQLLTAYVETTVHSRKYLEYWNHPEEINNRYWPSPIRENVIETVYSLPRWHPAQLPPVSQPIKDAPVIVSGDEVPITGIWQPEILNSLDKRTLELIGGTQTYCMNFLIQGNTAPNMVPEAAFELWSKTGDGPKYLKPSRGDVRWRLLWTDVRYGKNGIPEEEKDYLRTDPPPAAASVVLDMHRVEGGKSCPQSGFWFTPAKMNSRRYFKENEIMPVIGSDYGSTIWQWDSNQDMPKL